MEGLVVLVVVAVVVFVEAAAAVGDRCFGTEKDLFFAIPAAAEDDDDKASDDPAVHRLFMISNRREVTTTAAADAVSSFVLSLLPLCFSLPVNSEADASTTLLAVIDEEPCRARTSLCRTKRLLLLPMLPLRLLDLFSMAWFVQIV